MVYMKIYHPFEGYDNFNSVRGGYAHTLSRRCSQKIRDKEDIVVRTDLLKQRWNDVHGHTVDVLIFTRFYFSRISREG